VPLPGSHSDEYVLSLPLLVHAVPHLTTMHSPLPLLLLLLAAAAAATAASLVASLCAVAKSGTKHKSSWCNVTTSSSQLSVCVGAVE
jgi:hypothetical protein